MSQTDGSISAPASMPKTDACDHEFWCRKWMADNPPGTFDYHAKKYPIWIKCPNCNIDCRLPDSKMEEPNLNTKAVMERYFKNFHIKSGVSSIAPSTQSFHTVQTFDQWESQMSHSVPTVHMSDYQSALDISYYTPSLPSSDEFTTISSRFTVNRVRKLHLDSAFLEEPVEPVVAGIDHRAIDHLANLDLGDVDLGKEPVVKTKHAREKIPNLEAPVSEVQNSETVLVEMEKSETMVSEARDLEMLVSAAEKSQTQRTETEVSKTQSSEASISDSQPATEYDCGVM